MTTPCTPLHPPCRFFFSLRSLRWSVIARRLQRRTLHLVSWQLGPQATSPPAGTAGAAAQRKHGARAPTSCYTPGGARPARRSRSSRRACERLTPILCASLHILTCLPSEARAAGRTSRLTSCVSFPFSFFALSVLTMRVSIQIVALDMQQFDVDSHCGAAITITIGGKTAHATIADRVSARVFTTHTHCVQCASMCRDGQTDATRCSVSGAGTTTSI